MDDSGPLASVVELPSNDLGRSILIRISVRVVLYIAIAAKRAFNTYFLCYLFGLSCNLMLTRRNYVEVQQNKQSVRWYSIMSASVLPDLKSKLVTSSSISLGPL